MVTFQLSLVEEDLRCPFVMGGPWVEPPMFRKLERDGKKKNSSKTKASRGKVKKVAFDCVVLHIKK